MNNTTYKGSPFTLIGTNIPFRPSPEKSRPGWGDWDAEIAEGICQIQLRRPVEMLLGWVYFDPFLRFLHTIGKNAALLKHLTFEGVVKIHCCTASKCSKCDDDLVLSLRLYIPFIIKFCTGLERLTLKFKYDKIREEDPRDPDDPRPKTAEEALKPVLENELREFPTLTHLEVVTTKCILVGDMDFGHYEDRRVDFAIPTINWFRERGNREHEAPEQNGIVNPEATGDEDICDFCGEDHVWAECRHLCGFCGRYGHFRSTCPPLHEIYDAEGVPRCMLH